MSNMFCGHSIATPAAYISQVPRSKEEARVTDSGLRQVDTHTPNPVPLSARSLPRHSSFIRARMRRHARTDPSGGRSVISVPTGTKGRRLAAYPLSERPNHACLVERLASAEAAGRVKWKVAPPPPQLSLAQIRPPCHSTMDLLIARPMPLP